MVRTSYRSNFGIVIGICYTINRFTNNEPIEGLTSPTAKTTREAKEEVTRESFTAGVIIPETLSGSFPIYIIIEVIIAVFR